MNECGLALEAGLKAQIDAMAKELSGGCQDLVIPFNAVQWDKTISAQMEARLQEDFKARFAKVFGNYKTFLSGPNFEKLMGILTPAFTQRLEDVIKTKKFSTSGVVLLKRAMPMLIGLFECETPFERVNDILTVLTLSAYENVADVWGKRAKIERPVKLKLNELKAVMALRIDWAGKDLGFLFEDS